jgi:hypothetical protein
MQGRVKRPMSKLETVNNIVHPKIHDAQNFRNIRNETYLSEAQRQEGEKVL